MTTTKVEFPGATGELLAARLDTPSRPPTAVALFAHCFTCSKNSSAATSISEGLVEEGIAVLRFDFTGLGNSEGDFGNTNFASNIEDLLSAADWLDEHLEAPSLLVGHSLGGAAVLAAAPHLASVKAVATVGAPADPAHVRRLLSNRGSSDDAGDRADEDINIGGRTFTVSSKFLADLDEFPLSQTIAALDSALLVMHSPADETVDFSNGQQIFDEARQPKSFVALADADHLLSDARDGQYAGDVLASWARRYLDTSAERISSKRAVPEGHVVVEERGAGTFQNLVRTPSHQLHADEPESVGGNDTGPTPYDFLLAALGTCTSMTIRMYADRKKIPLDHVAVDLSQDRVHAKDCGECESEDGMVHRLERTLTIRGAMSDGQREDLLRIADRCPVHKTLHGEITIRTVLA